MDGAVRVFGFAAGIVIVLTTASSLFTTLVIPRMTSSRLLRSISRWLARVVKPVLGYLPTYEAKDRIMALVGPLAMVLLFGAWVLSLVVGFGLMIWWASGSTLASSLAIAGSSIFTLGIATAGEGSAKVLEILSAGFGLLVVALEIAYLPALYSAFSEREAEVTLLATRAGVPAWGPEVLARNHRFHTMGELPDLYRTWERWAAAVSESHTSYPSLIWFRSPDPTRSWLLALVAMLDASALHDSLCPGTSPRQARLCLQMGTNCLRSVARALRIPYDGDPLPTSSVRLTEEEFYAGTERLVAVDFPMERSPEEAWKHFAGWRVNYEPIVDALTKVVMPPPAPWLLERPALGEATWPLVVNRTPDNPEGEKFGYPGGPGSGVGPKG